MAMADTNYQCKTDSKPEWLRLTAECTDLLKPLVLKTTRMIITLETIVKMVTAKTRILDADNRGENVAEDDEDDDDDEDEEDDDKDSIE